jgi:hypothetical protein
MPQVYQPCILASKKRYVGMAYSSAAQTVPVFDAKGIETVRRDTCPLVAKTLERSLRVLFATHDLSSVKAYLQRQWSKVQADRMSVADAMYAKEARLGTYVAERTGQPDSLPAAAVVARLMHEADPRAVPRYGRRVPYVVVEGALHAPLRDLVMTPHEFLSGNFRLCTRYYLRMQNAALNRLLGLAGADVPKWFRETPKPRSRLTTLTLTRGGAVHDRSTINNFYTSDECPVCMRMRRCCRAQALTAQHFPLLLPGVRRAGPGDACALQPLRAEQDGRGGAAAAPPRCTRAHASVAAPFGLVRSWRASVHRGFDALTCSAASAPTQRRVRWRRRPRRGGVHVTGLPCVFRTLQAQAGAARLGEARKSAGGPHESHLARVVSRAQLGITERMTNE